MTTFKTLLWTSYALEVLIALAQLARVKQDEVFLVLILDVLFLGLSAWINVMLVRGKNWVRMAAIAMYAVSFPAIFVAVQEKPAWENALNVVYFLLGLWLIRMMFTEPIRHLFALRR